MRNLSAFLLVLALIAGFTIGSRSIVTSQDQDSSSDVTCDSDLILLWYLAERYFAFGAVQSTLAQSEVDPAIVVDLNRFNQGQYTPLFTALRSAQDPGTMALPGTALDQEWLSVVTATMQMDDAAFQDFIDSMRPADTNAFVDLAPIRVGGELPECSQLRTQLRRFFAALAFHDLESGFGVSLGLNMNANVNANENVNANVNTNANANVNTNENANTNANVNTNENVNTNTNVNTNENVNTNTNDNVGNTNDNNDDNDNDDDDDDDNSGSGSSNSGSGSDDDSSGTGSGGDDDNDNDDD